MKVIQTISTLMDKYDYSGYDTPAGELKAIQDSSEDEMEKKILQIEIDSLNFSLYKGKPQSMFSTTDKSGLVIQEYPSLKAFNDEALAYLTERLKGTSNSRLKIRYGQILSNTKSSGKGEAIKATIDFYLVLIHENSNIDNRGHFYSDLSNVMALSISSKYKIETVTKLIIDLILNDNKPYDSFLVLIPEILSNSKYFSEKDLKRVLVKGDQIWNNKEAISISYLQMIADKSIDLANKLRQVIKSKSWHERLGNVFEDMIEIRKKDDSTGMMPLHFCEKAINSYRKAGRKEKVNELLKQLTTLKANLKLDTFNFTFDNKDIIKLYRYHKDVAKNLMTKEAKFIYGFLAHDSNIFPDLPFLRKIIKARKTSFEDFAQVTAYDINKNPKHQKTKEKSTEELDINLMKDYDWYVQIVANQFLREVFIQGLYKGKLNFRTIIDHLYKHSWIGKNITYKDSGGLPFAHNWLALIAPALMEFLIH